MKFECTSAEIREKKVQYSSVYGKQVSTSAVVIETTEDYVVTKIAIKRG